MFRLRFTLACALFCAGGCEVSATVGGAAQVHVDGDTSSSGEVSLDGVDADSSSSAPDREPSGGDASTDNAGTSSEASSADDSEGLASSSTDESPPSDPDSSSSSTVGDEPDASSSSSGADIGEFAVNCCAPDDAPGCGDAELEACVCAIDSYCCDTAWDEACVNTASYGDCGDPCGGLIPIPAGDCCDANLAGGNGCIDEYVQECVCGADPYCCTQTWDDVCVGYVDEYGCGYCG